MKIGNTLIFLVLLLITQYSYAKSQVSFFQVSKQIKVDGAYDLKIGFYFDSDQFVIYGVNEEKTKNSISLKVNDNEVDGSNISYKFERLNKSRIFNREEYGQLISVEILAKDIFFEGSDKITIEGNAFLRTRIVTKHNDKNKFSSLKVGDSVRLSGNEWEISQINPSSMALKGTENRWPWVFFNSNGERVVPKTGTTSKMTNNRAVIQSITLEFDQEIKNIDTWGIIRTRPGDTKMIKINENLVLPM